MEQIYHKASIAGYITDAITQQAISGVEVEIIGQNLRPQDVRKVQSHEDGFFHFLNIVAGEYQVSGLVPVDTLGRYGGAKKTHETLKQPTFILPEIKVQYDADGRPILDPRSNVQLLPTRLFGQITRQDSNHPISYVSVQVRGSEIHTFADKDGKYSLSTLQAGKFTIQVSANGFSTLIRSFTLTAGKEEPADFELELK